MPYKVKRPPKSYDIEVLSLAVAALGKEVGELEATNTHLSFRHSILQATCEILDMLGVIKQTGQPCSAEAELLAQLRVDQALMRGPDCDACSIRQLQEGDNHVQQLLQPQQGSSTGSSSSLGGINTSRNGDSCALIDLGEDETLGTLSDPLRSLRLSLQGNSTPANVENITLRDLQEDYQDTVNQLAHNMAFLDNPFRRSQKGDSNPFEKVKMLLTRHGQVLTSLLIGGAAHLIPQFMMSDVITGEQKEEHDLDLYDFAVQRLGLSPDQKRRIRATLDCFQGLLSSIIKERTVLQQQLRLPPGCNPMLMGSNGSISSSNGSSPSSSMSSGMLQAAAAAAALHANVKSSADPATAQAFKAALNQQQQAAWQEHHHHQHKLAQMVKLLKKESLLKCCTWVGIEGCLTWVQLAKLATCCYPHPASPLALAQAVSRQLEQQEPQ